MLSLSNHSVTTIILRELRMDQMMSGMGAVMMGGMWLFSLLVLVVLVLAIAALIKYLRSGPK
jgi:uncharacterized membrane protein